MISYEYPLNERIRTLLRRGIPVKQVAAEVGYANASALGGVAAAIGEYSLPAPRPPRFSSISARAALRVGA